MRVKTTFLLSVLLVQAIVVGQARGETLPEDRVSEIVIKGLVHVLEEEVRPLISIQLGDDVTRQGFLEKVNEIGIFDLDGISLTYGPGDNQGMDQVFLTVIQSDGSFRAVDRLEK